MIVLRVRRDSGDERGFKEKNRGAALLSLALTWEVQVSLFVGLMLIEPIHNTNGQGGYLLFIRWPVVVY